MTKIQLEYARVSARQVAEIRGAVCSVMAATKAYKSYPIGCITAWIDPAIFVRQICVVYDEKGSKPVGYATWAFLAPDTEERWLYDERVMLDVREWNEDGRLWVLDFVVLPGYCHAFASHLKRTVFAGYDELFFVRRRSDAKHPHVRRLTLARNVSISCS